VERLRIRLRLARSLRAIALGVIAAGFATALFEWDLGRGLAAPAVMLALAPPVVYGVFASVMMREAPAGQRLTWVVIACGVNAAIGLATTLTLSFSHPLSFEGAITRAFGGFVPAPLIHLAAAPMVLLTFRPRVKRARAVARARGIAPRAPGAPVALATPNYDDVLRKQASTPWATTPGFSGTRPDITPAPPLVGPTVIATATPLVGPEVIATAAPPVVPRPPVTSLAPPPPPPAVGATPRPSAHAVPSGLDEPVLRIAFERLAPQLPAEVFVLPPGRLSESLLEPHTLVVPQRLVVPQLREGAIEIPWTLIEDQFPDLALAMPRTEVRKRFPDWTLSLPLDEVIGQIPAELIRVAAPPVDLSSIASFPAPFTPGPADSAGAIEESPMVVADQSATVPSPSPIAPTVSSVPSSITAPQPEYTPAAAPERPIAPPPSSPAPTTPPVLPRAPAPAPTTPPVLPRASVPAPAAAEPLVSSPTEPEPEAPRRDEQLNLLARALAAGLAPLGALEGVARRLGGRPLITFAPPALDRDAIDELAARGLALLERLAPRAIDQVTLRTSRLACVMAPLASGGAVVSAVRRGTPIAFLEILTGRARGAAGRAGTSLAVPATVSVTPVTEGHRQMSEVARALACFGPLVPTEAAAARGAPAVYVFAARADPNVAAAARAVHEALVSGHDESALGRLDSVTLRQGRERVIVRPLRLAVGTTALLAAAGEVALTGRAQRAAARAATLLEAR